MLRSSQLTISRYVRVVRQRLGRVGRRFAARVDPQQDAVETPAGEATAGAALSSGPDFAGSLPVSIRKTSAIVVLADDGGGLLSSLVAAGYAHAEGILSAGRDLAAVRDEHPALASTQMWAGDVATVLEGMDEDRYRVAIIAGAGDVPSAAWGQLARIASHILVLAAESAPANVAHRALLEAGMEHFRDHSLPSISATGERSAAREYRRMESVATLWKFWRQPAPEGNKPHDYLRPVGRSKALAEIISDLPHGVRILEVGCNIGRNLAYLYDQGYTNLAGIEINPRAIELLRETYPQLESVDIHEGTAGEKLRAFEDDEFDLVFTMAVIEHLHPDEAATAFDDMVRIGEEVLAIEPGDGADRGRLGHAGVGRLSHRQYPHDIPSVFCGRGMKLVLQKPMRDFEFVKDDPAMDVYTAWRFNRSEGSVPAEPGR